MRLDLPFDEALAFARSSGPLPELVRSLRAEASVMHAEIDLRLVESSSLGARLALAAAGTVLVSVRPAGFAAGVADFAVTMTARGFPMHRLVPYLLGPIENAIERSGLPAGLVTVDAAGDDPVVHVDVQRAVDTRVEGMTVTSLELVDDVIRVTAEVGAFRVL